MVLVTHTLVKHGYCECFLHLANILSQPVCSVAPDSFRMVYIESISPTTANDVLLYYPNLIGYLRVLCTIASLFLMMTYPHLWLTATLLYILSFVGDLFGKSTRSGQNV